MKNLIQNFLSNLIYLVFPKKSPEWTKKAKLLFPYIDLKLKPEDYPLLWKEGENASLPRILQPIWNIILEKNSLLAKYGEDINKALYKIVSEYVSDDKKEYIMLSSGIISNKKLPVTYMIQINPSSEPFINLTLTTGNFRLQLSCQKWCMIYRTHLPSCHNCDWYLNVERYDFSNGSFVGKESVEIGLFNIYYSGSAFFGKKIEENRYFYRIEHDKFESDSAKIKLESHVPFLKKLNDELLVPFSLTIRGIN